MRLKAYIDRELGKGDIGDSEKDDGSVAILMTRGDLTGELSAASVAQGDDFTITGTAKGSKDVDILIVAPKGYSGTNIEDSTEKKMYIGSTSVTTDDDTYYKKITVDDNADTGRYLVMVLSKGANEWYGSGTDWKTLDDALDTYSLRTRTQDEVFEIIDDIMSLSDDLLWMDMINVESPYVTLDPVADVAIGEPLEVSGTTNRESGFTIVVTVKGPTELTPETVKVDNGTFNATLDTADALVGTYIVKADDGDGNTDEKTVDIGAAAPTAAPTEAPTEPTEAPAEPTEAPAAPTAAPTEAPTAAPTEKPKPTPGFEGVFAIAGLLAIAYLVLRRRN